MKSGLVLLSVAIALPAISNAFLFGVTITDAAGLVIAAANPAQTAAIIGIGVIGATLAAAAGALAAQLLFPPPPAEPVDTGYGAPIDTGYGAPVDAYGAPDTSYGAPVDSYGAPVDTGYGAPAAAAPATYETPAPVVDSYGAPAAPAYGGNYRRVSKYRQRRQAVQNMAFNNLNEIFDTIFVDIAKSNMEGCFQRLVCDISARPNAFEKNLPIVTGVELTESQSLNLSVKAHTVSHKLLEALKFGKATQDVNACEEVFNQCQWTGGQMDQVIAGLQKQVIIEP